MPPRQERASDIRRDEAQLTKLSTSMEYIQKDIGEIKQDVKDIKTNYVTQSEFKVLIDSLTDYVKRTEFAPVKAVVYGMVGLILTGVLVALLTLIIKQ